MAVVAVLEYRGTDPGPRYLLRSWMETVRVILTIAFAGPPLMNPPKGPGMRLAGLPNMRMVNFDKRRLEKYPKNWGDQPLDKKTCLQTA